MALHINLVFAFGLLGNIISCFVCLAPLPTFYMIYKKKTSQGFQSIPYVIALFSAMLWLFYAQFQNETTLLITINSFTFFMEAIYISLYLFYATKNDKILTVKLVLLWNVFGFGLIAGLIMFLTRGEKRVEALGWICMIFSLCVFVAPLGILRKVIKTKSVEFMPISLSFFLTLSAVMWFFYGYLKKDYFVAIPNVLGFFFGIIQMVLYIIYKTPKTTSVSMEEQIVAEVHIVDIAPKDSSSGIDYNTVVAVKENINGSIEVVATQILNKEHTKQADHDLETVNKV